MRQIHAIPKLTPKQALVAELVEEIKAKSDPRSCASVRRESLERGTTRMKRFWLGIIGGVLFLGSLWVLVFWLSGGM